MDDSGKVGEVTSSSLSNAFSPEYLERLREGSETFGSGEGEAVGPWELRHEEGVYPLFRSWEGFEHGDSPEAVFRLREAGLLFFAVRPAAGRDPLFRPLEPATEQGFAIESSGEVVGHLRFFNPDWLHAAHVGTAAPDAKGASAWPSTLLWKSCRTLPKACCRPSAPVAWWRICSAAVFLAVRC